MDGFTLMEEVVVAIKMVGTHYYIFVFSKITQHLFLYKIYVTYSEFMIELSSVRAAAYVPVVFGSGQTHSLFLLKNTQT